MKNKIDADSWYIAWHNGISEQKFNASIEYKLADESNKKSHRFATFEEAYQWVKNQVNL